MNLYVSGEQLRCQKIVDLMIKHEIVGWTHANTTIQKNGRKENGCNVLLAHVTTREQLRPIWKIFQKELPIHCAYVSSPNYRGCVLDFTRESLCKPKE